ANGFGGQPFSLENLRSVRSLADRYHVRIFLDATRIIENAYQIKALENAYRDHPVWKIVREICSNADGLTMSLTKDFPTSIGAVAAFRDKDLYEEAFDFVLAMGDGLAEETRHKIHDALEFAKDDTSYILKRMHLSKRLHEGLASAGFTVVQPAGGHAVLVDLNNLLPQLTRRNFPAESLNHELYFKFGIRGSPHMASERQEEMGMNLFRLAVPILLMEESQIEEVIRHFKSWLQESKGVKPLKRTFIPLGLSGEFRAWYEQAA
ncbi:MAG: beta-eliminating lyase-related protein, partial [Candidatus Omnitrophica bacterium]|nr:beta-eliminating lyase-related protein [Candidatus Omnitrophota bacterium]